MSEITQPIPARLKNVAVNGHVAGAADIIDDNLNKTQAVINAEIDEVLGDGGNVAFIDDEGSSPAVVPSFDPESQSVHVTSQVLSEQQKAQVRTNIGLNDVDTRISNAVSVEAARATGAEEVLDSRVDTLEGAVGTGGSVDSRISAAVATETTRAQGAESALGNRVTSLENEVGTGGGSNTLSSRVTALESGKADKATTIAGYGITDAYTKSETYTKTEVNGLVDTPHQEYVTVDAYANLPATGSKDTIYRVSNYNGSTSQVDASVYSEYAWNGSQYIFLCVKSQVGEVFDISAYNNNAKYADLAAALNGGANIPDTLRKGGMSVKFVQSNDNKYVQYRYMSSSTAVADFTNVANWQGVDDEPTAGSDNLVKSGGVFSYLSDYGLVRPKVLLNKLVWNNELISSNDYSVTSFIPIKENSSVFIGNNNPQKQLFYSKPEFSSEAFISEIYKTQILEVPEGAKYVVVQFINEYNTSGYDNLIIGSITDVNKLFSRGFFELPNLSGNNSEDVDAICKQNIAVKDVKMHGESLPAGMRLSIQKSATYTVVVLWSNAMAVYKQVRLANKALDTIEKVVLNIPNSDNEVEIEIDFSLIPLNFSTNKSVNNTPMFTAFAYNRGNSCIEIISQDTNIKDYSSSYTEVGYIKGSTGEHFNDNDYKCTQFIPITSNMKEVFVKLPEWGSMASAAFYDASQTYIPRTFVNLDSEMWLLIPDGAAYFRACIGVNETPVLRFKVNKLITDDSALSSIYDKCSIVKPINSRVFASYKDFICNRNGESCKTLREQVTSDEYAIILGFYCRLENYHVIASVNVLNGNSVITFGNIDAVPSNSDTFNINVQARVLNINGVGTLQLYRITSNEEILCTSKQLSFTIDYGKTYKIGYKKVYAGEPSLDKCYGYVEYFVQLNDVVETLKIEYRNDVQYNGVLSAILSDCLGKPYFGAKSGNVIYYNWFICSDYMPQAKAMIFGDSFVEGNTLSDTINKTYASLINASLGNNDLMILAKGGAEFRAREIESLVTFVKKYIPKYLIIALGVNNEHFNIYYAGMKTTLKLCDTLGVEPILVTITPYYINGDYDARSTVRTSINNFVRSSGRRYVDICAAVTTNNETRWKDGYVLPDGVHPSILGHQTIYETFIKEIPELFEV